MEELHYAKVNLTGENDENVPNPDMTERNDSPPPPTPEEARRTLEAALAEIGLVFRKKPSVVIKLEQHLTKPIFVDEVTTNAETASIPNDSSLSEYSQPPRDKKYWHADPRRGESSNKTSGADHLAILSLSPKIGPSVRHDQLSKSTTKLPELSSKPFGPPSARKTPLGSCQLNKIRSQSQIITTKSRQTSEGDEQSLTYAEFTSGSQSMRSEPTPSASGMRPHSVSRIESGQNNMRRDDSRLSLAAHHQHPASSSATNGPKSPQLGDLLRPLRFEQPGTVGREELIGREWLFEEVNSRLNSTRCVSIIGDAGCGKTTLIHELMQPLTGRQRHKYHEASYHHQRHHNGAKMSSSMSLHQLPPQPTNNRDSLAQAVVAYHFCQADNSATCLVPEFVRSLAGLLAASRHLVAYQQLLVNSSHLREQLSPQNCIRDSRGAFISGIVEPLRQLADSGKLPRDRHFIILLDSLDSAELHRPDYGPTIPNFLSEVMTLFPQQFKLVVTVRSSMRHLLDSFQTSTIRLDDFEHNQNILNDTILYAQSRLRKAPFIAAEVAVNGIIDVTQAQKLLLQKLIGLATGNFLYIKLLLDLIEARRLSLKSSSFSVLPSNLDELFSMLSNLQFPSLAAFDRVKPILAVCLASLYPLRDEQIYQSLKAGHVDSALSFDEFCRRLNSIGSILTRRIDGRRVFLHPLYREWLCIPQQQSQQRFIVDPREGHALIALLLSRQTKSLHFSATIELGHHVLKSSLFRGQRSQTGYSSSMQNTQWLMAARADVEGALISSRNLFYPNIRVTKLLLLSGAPVNARSQCLSGSPPLVVAAWSGALQFCRLLLEHGADPDAVNERGRTAVSMAAEQGHVVILELLYEAGANVLKVDSSGKAPAVYAAAKARTECVDFLLSREHPVPEIKRDLVAQVLVNAAGADCVQLVDIMLNYASYQPVAAFQCHVDQTDQLLGESALTMAAANGHLGMLRHLVESYGAQVDLENEQQLTALATGAKNGHEQCCSYLLSMGASSSTTNGDGRTALMMAAQFGHAQVVQTLVDQGARGVIDAQDGEGLTALSWAALKGKRAAAQVLITAGARLDRVDRVGRNLLHLAAISGDAATISLLQARGIDQHQTDSVNMRPLERAISSRNADATLLLLRSGSRPEAASWALAADRADLLFLLLHRTLEDGNKYYKSEHIEKASELYKLGLNRFQGHLLSSGLENAAELKASLLLGQSRCARRLGQQRQAESLASQALNLKPSWFHAYYARCRARVELGRLAEAYQDILEAARLEPRNRVIAKYAARLSEEGARLGLRLGVTPLTHHRRNFGSSDSLGSASVSSEMTIRDPPMPPPRTRPEEQEAKKTSPGFRRNPLVPANPVSSPTEGKPRPRPRTNPFYSMASYKASPPVAKRDETSQVTSTFSYLSLDRDPEQQQLSGKPKQTDL